MFYLTKRTDENQCTIGERCMVLADFSAIPAGTKGTITEIYDEGVMIEWDTSRLGDRDAYDMRPRSDGFSRDELEYLAFETVKHPRVDQAVKRDPEVTREI